MKNIKTIHILNTYKTKLFVEKMKKVLKLDTYFRKYTKEQKIKYIYKYNHFLKKS